MSEPTYWKNLDWRNGWDDDRKPLRVAASVAVVDGSSRRGGTTRLPNARLPELSDTLPSRATR